MDRAQVPRRKQACPANLSSIRSGRSSAAFFIHERSTFNPRLARIRSLPNHAHPRDCRVRRSVLGRAFLLTLFGRRPRCVQSVVRLQLRRALRGRRFLLTQNLKTMYLHTTISKPWWLEVLWEKTIEYTFQRYMLEGKSEEEFAQRMVFIYKKHFSKLETREQRYDPFGCVPTICSSKIES